MDEGVIARYLQPGDTETADGPPAVAQQWRNRKDGGENEKDDAVAVVVTETPDGLKSADAVQALTSKSRRQAAALERGARGDDAPSAKPSCAYHSERAARCAQGNRDVSSCLRAVPATSAGNATALLAAV